MLSFSSESKLRFACKAIVRKIESSYTSRVDCYSEHTRKPRTRQYATSWIVCSQKSHDFWLYSQFGLLGLLALFSSKRYNIHRTGLQTQAIHNLRRITFSGFYVRLDLSRKVKGREPGLWPQFRSNNYLCRYWRRGLRRITCDI